MVVFERLPPVITGAVRVLFVSVCVSVSVATLDGNVGVPPMV